MNVLLKVLRLAVAAPILRPAIKVALAIAVIFLTNFFVEIPKFFILQKHPTSSGGVFNKTLNYQGI